MDVLAELVLKHFERLRFNADLFGSEAEKHQGKVEE